MPVRKEKLDAPPAALAPGAQAGSGGAIDPRIDQLGFVKLLQDGFADDLKSQVKVEMLGREQFRASGEFFEAMLVGFKQDPEKPGRWIPCTKQTVDPAKWFTAYENGRITRKKFLAALSVKRETALEAMGEDDLNKISSEKPVPPALHVKEIEGIKVPLPEALRALSRSIGK